MIQRKAAASLKPTNVIENNGNQWTFKIQSSLKNSEQHVTEGVDFEETTPDDKVCKGSLRRENDNKLVTEIRDPKTNAVRLTVTREVVNDKLVIVRTINNSFLTF